MQTSTYQRQNAIYDCQSETVVSGLLCRTGCFAALSAFNAALPTAVPANWFCRACACMQGSCTAMYTMLLFCMSDHVTSQKPQPAVGSQESWHSKQCSFRSTSSPQYMPVTLQKGGNSAQWGHCTLLTVWGAEITKYVMLTPQQQLSLELPCLPLWTWSHDCKLARMLRCCVGGVQKGAHT